MDASNFLKPEPAPAFEPAATLEGLLAQAARDPAYQPEFYRRLLLKPLVIITGDEPSETEPRRFTLQAGEKVRIVSLPDGRVPVFTSTERIFDQGVITRKVQFMQLKGRDLLEIVQDKTLVLNPYSNSGKELLPGEIKRLLAGTVLDTGHTITVKKAKVVQLGQPAEQPTALVQALARLLSQQPRVRAAYLGWLHDPASGEPPHYLICLDVEGEMRTISQQVGYVAQQLLRPQEIIDIAQMGQSSFTDYFLATKPFYER